MLYSPSPSSRPGEKSLKTFILCYLEQIPVVCYFNVLLCHNLCETATGYFLWYNGSFTGQLHNRIMAPKKKQEICLKGCQKYPILMEIWNIFTTQKSPYLRLQSPTEKSQISLSGSKKTSHVCVTRSRYDGLNSLDHTSISNDISLKYDLYYNILW